MSDSGDDPTVSSIVSRTSMAETKWVQSTLPTASRPGYRMIQGACILLRWQLEYRIWKFSTAHQVDSAEDHL